MSLRIFLMSVTVFVLGCGSTLPEEGRVPDHDEARRQLALQLGTSWSFAFKATIQEDVDGLTRETTSTGGYVETVRAVRQEGELTVVEVLRENLSDKDQPGGWSVQRRSGPIFYLIGALGQSHGDVPERYESHRPGRSVFVQRGALRLDQVANSWMAYLLPFRVGTMWHAHSEARELARTERMMRGVRSVVQRVGRMSTPAGEFAGCFEIATPGKRTQTTTWVCEAVGMVRRVTRRATGKPRFVIEEQLTRFHSP